MRKLFTPVIIFILTSPFANAQKNTLLLYGDVAYITLHAGISSKQSIFSFNPGIGYQFSNSWTAGIAPSINTNRYETGNTVSNGSDIKIGTFIRYTKQLSELFSLYAQFNASYLFGKDKYTGNVDEKYNGFQADLMPAVLVNLKKGFALSFSAGTISYQTYKYEGSPSKNSYFNFGLGRGSSFGLSKNFSL